MNGTITALLLTLIAGAATGIGGALVLFKKKISSNFLAGALGLSAGVMIFISLAELFPQAQAEIAATGSVKYGKALTLLAFALNMGLMLWQVGYAFRSLGARVIFRWPDWKLYRSMFGFSFWVMLNQLMDLLYWQIANVSGANQRTKGAVICSGQCRISSIQVTAGNRQVAVYDTSLAGYGDLTVGA